MEKTLEFIQQQIDETYEGIDVLLNMVSKADSVDEIVKLGRRIAKAHGKIEAFLEVKRQIVHG